jgi:hypothetical protein
MTIHDFANKHHVSLTRAEDGTLVVKGRNGEIYEYNDEELGVLIMPTSPRQVRFWGHACKKMLAAGMTLRQNGDHEGALSFGPNNPKAARLAMKLAGVRARRVPSAAQLEALSMARSHVSARTTAPEGL